MTTKQSHVGARVVDHIIKEAFAKMDEAMSHKNYTSCTCCTRAIGRYGAFKDVLKSSLAAQKKEIVDLIEDYKKHYPERIFQGKTVDSISARAMVNTCDALISKLEEI